MIRYRSCCHLTDEVVAGSIHRLLVQSPSKSWISGNAYCCISCGFAGNLHHVGFRRHFAQHVEKSHQAETTEYKHCLCVRVRDPFEIYCFICCDFQYCFEFDSTFKKKRVKPFSSSPAYRRFLERSLHDPTQHLPNGPIPCKVSYNWSQPKGMINMGNTCFMSSVLQVLIHNPILMECKQMENEVELCKCNGSNSISNTKEELPNGAADRSSAPDLCIYCEFKKLCIDSASTSKESPSVLVPSNMLYVMWRTVNYMAGYSQQDAHEFLIAFLDGLDAHSRSYHSAEPKLDTTITATTSVKAAGTGVQSFTPTFSHQQQLQGRSLAHGSRASPRLSQAGNSIGQLDTHGEMAVSNGTHAASPIPIGAGAGQFAMNSSLPLLLPLPQTQPTSVGAPTASLDSGIKWNSSRCSGGSAGSAGSGESDAGGSGLHGFLSTSKLERVSSFEPSYTPSLHQTSSSSSHAECHEILDIFSGIMKSRLTCTGCGNSSCVNEKFLDLGLSIAQPMPQPEHTSSVVRPNNGKHILNCHPSGISVPRSSRCSTTTTAPGDDESSASASACASAGASAEGEGEGEESSEGEVPECHVQEANNSDVAAPQSSKIRAGACEMGEDDGTDGECDGDKTCAVNGGSSGYVGGGVGSRKKSQSSSSSSGAANDSDEAPITLLDCLRHFTAVESLSEEVFCEKCGRARLMEKQLTISQPPPVLVLHLKRFDMLNNRKIKTKVSLPTHRWDITECTSSGRGEQGTPARSPPASGSTNIGSKDTEQDNFSHSSHDHHHNGREESDQMPVEYDLQGVVCHSGSMNQGHYISYISDLSQEAKQQKENAGIGQWLRCDDDSITSVPEDEVKECEGYVLFYIRRNKTDRWY